MSNQCRSLSDWLARIEDNHSCNIQLGLERVVLIAKRADLLNFDCPVVMIGGTNGKGSTLATLAALLDGAELNYATYSSPHLLSFNERMRFNGEMVSDSALCEAFEFIESISTDTSLTYFEFITLAAFYLFKKAPLDVLLLEVGLGGRLDAVNAVSADIAVITAISHDHEAYLGDTLEAIAREKAGILRPLIPVVLSKDAQQETIWEAIHENKNVAYVQNKDFDYSELVNKLTNNFLPIDSVSLAMAIYTILGKTHLKLPLLEKSLQSLEGVGMVGRFHCVTQENQSLIFDVAHNGAGAKWLADRLEKRPKNKKRYAIWSSLSDKSLNAIVSPLVSHIDEWFVGEIEGNPRATKLDDLRQVLEMNNVKSIHAFKTIEEAMLKAKERATKEDESIVFGSFFTVAKGYVASGLGSITQVKNGLFYD